MAPAKSSLGLFLVYVVLLARLLLLHVEFQRLQGGWLRLLLRDFGLLDLFH